MPESNTFPSSAANGNLLLHSILSAASNVEALPAKDEVAQIRANEDANDDVSVVVHGQQHDEVGDGKL